MAAFIHSLEDNAIIIKWQPFHICVTGQIPKSTQLGNYSCSTVMAHAHMQKD